MFDVGVGRRQFSHAIARRQRAAGFAPDTVSTDMTEALAASTSLVEVMAMLMAVGYSFPEVVAMATSNAAAALGLGARLGAIAAGHQADLTVVDLVAGSFRHTDGTGAARRRLGYPPRADGEGRTAGRARPRPHPWGWLPSLRSA